MNQFCTCSGGSASTLKLNKKRVAVASCKVCGGKPIVDSGRSRSRSMVSTVGVELTSIINSDLRWKPVSKGNRSASRRPRKPISRDLKESEDLTNKDPKGVEDMPVSESEKLGVTILGRRFSDKVQHIPIKKRRVSLRSASPPPQMGSPQPEEPLGHQESVSNLISKKQVMPIDTVVANELGLVVSTEITIDGKNSEEFHEKLDDNEDFSGISILAAAACNNSIEGGINNAKEGSTAEESFEVLVNAEPCSLVKESFKGHSLSCDEVSNDGTASPQNLAARVGDIVDGKNMECPFSDNSPLELQSPPSSKDDGMLRTLESSSRDDRSHWDLNVVMDAWENPCGDAIGNSQTSTVCVMPGDRLCCEKEENLEICEVQREPGDTKYSIERIGQPNRTEVSVDVQEDISKFPVIRISVTGNIESNREEHKLGACTAPGEASTFKERDPSLEIDNPPNLSKETKLFHDQERISSDAEAVISAAVEDTSELSTLVNACAVPDETTAQRVSFDAGENGEIRSSHQVLSENACIDHSCPEANHIPSKPLSEECINEASPFDVGEETGDGCAADAQCGEPMCLRSPQVDKHDVAPPYTVVSKKASCDGLDADIESGLLSDGYASKKKLSTGDGITAQALQPEPGPLRDAIDKSDKVGASKGSPNCEELSTSGGSVGNVDCVAVADRKELNKNISKADDEHLNAIELDKLTCESLTQTLGVADTPMAMGGLSSLEGSKSFGDDPVYSSGKIAVLEDPFDDNDYDSDDSHSDRGHFFGFEKDSEPQVDYDSQYEDGELRESVVHGWEEDVDDEGDAEHVDYGSDNRDTYADYPMSMSVQVKERSAEFEYEGDQVEENNVQEANSQPCLGGLSRPELEAQSGKRLALNSRGHFGRVDGIEKVERDAKVHRKLSEGVAKDNGNNDFCARGSAAKESVQLASSKVKFSGWDQLPEGCRSSADEIMDVSHGIDKKNHTGSHSRDSLIGISRRELSSCIEGPTSSNALLRKDSACILGVRSNSFDDSNPRFKRDTSSVKSIGRGGSSLHLHGRGRGGDRWVDPPPGRPLIPNHHHSPSHYGSAGFVHPGPKNAAAAAAAKVESSGFIVAPNGTIVKAGSVGSSGRVHTHSVHCSSQGVHRSLTRRGSPPADRDEAFDLHVGLGLVGKRSPDRSINVYRGSRSGRYGPRFGTGLRENYHGSVDDSIGSSMQPPLARREQSFSPIQRQGPRTRSRSRSRSHSPHNMWPSPRRRNGYIPGLRQYNSRSPPNFRSDARLDRVRSPHRRPSFRGADHMVVFDSVPGSRVSPSETASRWIDDRKDAANHFREHGYKHRSSVSDRSSPGRPLRPNRRFELMEDSPVRLRPDEYYRPMYPRRFTEMVRADRGPPRCGDESDDDKRKHGGERYGMIHPGRRYDTDDHTVKRFRYNEDGFAAQNSRNKDTSRFQGRGSTKDFIRGIDSRLGGDAPRRGREDRGGHFRYDREGRYNVNFKPFGIRDCDEDIAPRRRRLS